MSCGALTDRQKSEYTFERGFSDQRAYADGQKRQKKMARVKRTENETSKDRKGEERKQAGLKRSNKEQRTSSRTSEGGEGYRNVSRCEGWQAFAISEEGLEGAKVHKPKEPSQFLPLAAKTSGKTSSNAEGKCDGTQRWSPRAPHPAPGLTNTQTLWLDFVYRCARRMTGQTGQTKLVKHLYLRWYASGQQAIARQSFSSPVRCSGRIHLEEGVAAYPRNPSRKHGGGAAFLGYAAGTCPAPKRAGAHAQHARPSNAVFHPEPLEHLRLLGHWSQDEVPSAGFGFAAAMSGSSRRQRLNHGSLRSRH